MKVYGIDKGDGSVVFGQLLGMCDHMTFILGNHYETITICQFLPPLGISLSYAVGGSFGRGYKSILSPSLYDSPWVPISLGVMPIDQPLE